MYVFLYNAKLSMSYRLKTLACKLEMDVSDLGMHFNLLFAQFSAVRLGRFPIPIGIAGSWFEETSKSFNSDKPWMLSGSLWSLLEPRERALRITSCVMPSGSSCHRLRCRVTNDFIVGPSLRSTLNRTHHSEFYQLHRVFVQMHFCSKCMQS